jgi:hypothetical protein
VEACGASGQRLRNGASPILCLSAGGAFYNRREEGLKALIQQFLTEEEKRTVRGNSQDSHDRKKQTKIAHC